MKRHSFARPAIPTHPSHQFTIAPFNPSHQLKVPKHLNRQVSFAPGNFAPSHFNLSHQPSVYKYQHPNPPMSPMSPNFNPNVRYDVQKEVWNPSNRTKQGKQDRERGGWTPVINKHVRKKMNIYGDEEIITLFIDNLPNPVDKNWLMKTFSKFGKIRDVFIPLKRNISGNRFGFVMFECQTAANRAIRTLNGTWSYDKQLGVKIAGYSRNINHSSRSNAGVFPTGGNNNISIFGEKKEEKSFAEAVVGAKVNGEKLVSRVFPTGGNNNISIFGEKKEEKSFAEAVVGAKVNGEKLVSIKGKTDGAGWLSRSAVGKLNVLVDNDLITEAFHDEGIKQIQVRSMGGLYKIVSFANKEVMQTVTESECLSGWFEYLKPWNGEAVSTSRVVWLNCTGIPLEAWCFSTFKSIGSQWGNVLTLDRDTSKRLSFDKGRILIETEYNVEIDCWINVEVREKNFKVRIREEPYIEGKGIVEKTAVVAMVSGGESESELEKDLEDEGSDDSANKVQEEIHVGGIFARLNKDLVVGKHQFTREKYKQGNGFTESASTTNKEAEESQHKLMKGGQDACLPVDSNIPLTIGPGEAITTSGDEGLLIFNGLKYNGEEVTPETNANGLEIVIGPFDKDPDGIVRHNESSHSQTVDGNESSKINKRGNEETIKEMGRKLKIRALRKSRRKLIVDLLAIQDEVANSKSVDEIYQFTGSKELPESADLDSTGATASTEGINQRNAAIIREAEETIKLGKVLGIKFNGNETEVCQKLIQMELSDNANAVEAVGVDVTD